MKKDIENRADVELLINSFYEKVKTNNILGYIFNDIARVHWETHLPRMYSFWTSLLLGEQGFSGDPMSKHIELSKKVSLTELEFSEWLGLFNATVDELFEGIVANDAKTRASNIARLMLYKIQAMQK